jgi:hypothetical protein
MEVRQGEGRSEALSRLPRLSEILLGLSHEIKRRSGLWSTNKGTWSWMLEISWRQSAILLAMRLGCLEQSQMAAEQDAE